MPPAGEGCCRRRTGDAQELDRLVPAATCLPFHGRHLGRNSGEGRKHPDRGGVRKGVRVTEKIEVGAQGEAVHRPMPEARRETLTVAIPTKDVAALLANCLASVAWADEIIVVDMFSSDDTEEV